MIFLCNFNPAVHIFTLRDLKINYAKCIAFHTFQMEPILDFYTLKLEL